MCCYLFSDYNFSELTTTDIKIPFDVHCKAFAHYDVAAARVLGLALSQVTVMIQLRRLFIQIGVASLDVLHSGKAVS